MEEFKTRGQRRRFQTLEKRRKLVSGAAVVGTGLAIAPVALTLPGTQVEAAEYNYQQADAAQSLCPGNAPSEMLYNYHKSVAAGGIGMTTLAYAAVTRSGLSFDGLLVHTMGKIAIALITLIFN